MEILLSFALASALRLGPFPVESVAPGETRLVELDPYVVNSAAGGYALETASSTGLPGRSLGARNLVVGPAADPGLYKVEIAIRNEAGERAAATLVVSVGEAADRTTTLRYRAEGTPSKVVAAGEFNGWNQGATPLADPDGDGVWEATLRVAAGRYPYKFVVDGNWIPDPGNPVRIPDGFGGENTILVVGDGGGAPPRLLSRSLEAGRAVAEFVADGAPPAAVVALVDERPAQAEVDGTSIRVALPNDGAAHAVRIVAADAAGRLARPLSFEVEGAAPRWDWRDAVLYYAVTDRFENGDPSNDSPIRQEGLAPRANYLGGDFAGIRRKIEEGYFDRLGANAIWISPHVDNPPIAYRDALPPNKLFSGYHGYWPVASDRPEERFGTMEDLKAMIDAAHARGIKVLFDMVYTHVHLDHPLYREHPDWFVPLVLPDGRKNIRLFDEFPMTTWFDDFLPKVDYENDSAVAYQIAITREWIERTGVDGFRLDAVKHIPHRFWRALRTALAEVEASRGPDLQGAGTFYLVGESIDSRRTISSFMGPTMLDGQFDFPLYWAVRESLALGTGGLDRLEAEVGRSEREYPEGSVMSPLIGNHDMSRFASYADGDIPNGVDEKAIGWGVPVQVDDPATYAKMKAAFTFLLSLDGVPMIYYGDEIGLAGAHDPDNRRVMRFGDRVSAAERGLLEHVGRAAAARRAHPAIRRGVRRPLLAETERLAFLKTHFGDAALTALRRGGGGGGDGADAAAFDLEVGPDLADGTVLVDALGGADAAGAPLRARVEGGRIRFTLPPLSSAILVPER